jgi:hypothetical protein
MKQIKCIEGNHKHRCIGENIYSKVCDVKRLALLKMVKEEGKSLKEAAKELQINYSTAKTILRVYRIENRIYKKIPSQKKIFRQNDYIEEDCYELKANIVNDKINLSISSDDNINNVNTTGNSFSLRKNSDLSQNSLNNEQEEMTVKNPFENYPEMVKSIKVLFSTLQMCIGEVINNEVIIRNIQNMNYQLYIQSIRTNNLADSSNNHMNNLTPIDSSFINNTLQQHIANNKMMHSKFNNSNLKRSN